MTWKKWWKEKESIDIEFTEQKADPENDKTAIDFRWSDVLEEYEDIANANFIDSYKTNWWKKFQKKVTRGSVSSKFRAPLPPWGPEYPPNFFAKNWGSQGPIKKNLK